MNHRSAARTIVLLLGSALLAACQSLEPPRPEPDPAQPPPAPIVPAPQSLPPQGQVVTAPLPGRPEPAPVVPVAPARLTLRDAQTLLNDMGYDAGAADGVAGPRTAAALRAFQRDQALPLSGRLDQATRQALTASR